MKNIINKIFNSSMGYLPFKIIEGIMGILSLSLYTHLLSVNNYGNYGTANSTMMLTYLLSIGWFVFVAIRYIKEQKSVEEKQVFFSNILALQGIIMITLFIVYAVISMIMISAFNYDSKLLLVYLLFFIGYTSSQFYVHLLLYVNERLLNVQLVVIAAFFKPVLVGTLFLLKVPTEYIIFIGHGLVDLTVGLIAIVKIKPYKYFRISKINKSKFKEFFVYGFPLIGLTLTMYVLNVSDRYLIRGIYSDVEVGYYTPNYSLASAAFLMISYGLSRGFYPKLLGAFKDNDYVKTGDILAGAIKNYIFLALPAATGMFLLSQDICRIFLDAKYIVGHQVIGLVAIGMFFLGLAEYANKGWELSGNTKPIFYNSLKAAIVNIILNVIFIPIFGFVAAAGTTAISFLIYSIICFLNREKAVKYQLESKKIVSIFIGNIVMILCVLLSAFIPLSGILLLVIRVAIGIVSYICVILLLKVYNIKEF